MLLPNLSLSHSMLYRTHHHPFLYTFNPFSPSPLSSILLSPPSPRLQEMECGFIDGFGAEMLKTAGLADDDLFVDELLDFSNDLEEHAHGEQHHQLDQPEDKEKTTASSLLLTPPPPDNDDFGSLPETQLTVPAEGLESLEWLSHFVEDSFSDYSLTGKLPPKLAAEKEGAATASEQPCFTTPVQTKARTKRARTGVRIWPILSPSFTESSTSSSSSSSSTTSFSPPNPWLLQSQTGESFLGKLAAKKQKKKPADGQPRRCSHCGVTKTPQWRAGPLGSKTLCNACGVRYKSGRLLPEYRPACSPTFSIEMHSNNHRRVLEMRRKKESETEAAGPLQPAPNF
ncbi:GATA transcription factor 5-like [Salvia miltiorrhiza]|uniref:GATA transcription factor 5-like n=1 Tax=Salvia miltiorrhiza TaxID=226208 RepID=UPI0025AD8D4E|nr:GATA transcription factor 5-like [Salvia miltiorrhiza]